VAQAAAGKTIALFAVPGAFTPTCSAKHVPSYLQNAEALKAAGVDEIWCLAVNDAFVMGAWARDEKTAGKVRMLADGDAAFAKATGLTLDLTGKGLGLRSNRYSMLVKDGKVDPQHRRARASSRSATAPRCWRRPRADGIKIAFHA
jgi:peroxiredoxin